MKFLRLAQISKVKTSNLVQSDAYKESLIIANSDHLNKLDKSIREKNIWKAFAENHLDIYSANLIVLITKTCKLGTILSKW